MEVVDNPAEHRLEIRFPDGSIAFAEYRKLTGKILFPHTVVPEAHEGQGVGTMLIRHGLDWARREGWAVMPQCPFFASYMKRHPETHDLLEPSYAKLLGVST